MEVDLQNCRTLFSLLPSDIKCLQKYVESLFRSPLVCSEFYALYFFIFWVFFIALHSFPLYGWLGNLYIMVCLLMPIVLTLFWGLHFDTLCLYSLLSHLSTTEKSLHSGNFLTPTATNTRSAWQLGLLLHLLWSDGLGHSLLIGVRTQDPWRGCILFIDICWGLCQLVWAATDLHWLERRDVRTCATIRPLLGWALT